MEIKKNQFDATAGIIYSNGVSLIHWALGFGMIFIKWPDVDLARKEEQEYIQKYGKDVYEVSNYFGIGCETMATDLY